MTIEKHTLVERSADLLAFIGLVYVVFVTLTVIAGVVQ